MKKCMWMAVVAAALACAGCNSNRSFLLTPAENVAPTIQGTVAVASATPLKQLENFLLSFGSSTAYATPPMPADCVATYGYMCLGWEIFTLVRQYDPAATYSGEDMINSENLYYDLNLAGLAYDDLSKSAARLSATKAVPSPFNFGATTILNETYDQGVNGLTSVNGFGYQTGEANIALRKAGTAKHFLVSIGSNEATGWTQGRHKVVMQGVYDSNSGDLELNYVQYMHYPTTYGNGMSDQVLILRTHIKGNEKTHYFEFQAGMSNDGSGPAFWNWSNIQGAGYSQGTSQHFLIFYRGTNAQADSNGVIGSGLTGGYYCVAADATKASFGASIYLQPAGYADTAIPADCAAYKTTVMAMPRWEITNPFTSTPTSTDYPMTDSSDLYTGSGAQHLQLSL